MPQTNNKFKFTEDYQWDLLRYTVQDNNGEKALKKYSDEYFTDINHQVIAYGLIQYYKKESRIPGQTMLKESLVSLLNSKKYLNLVTKDEQKNILSLLRPLYTEPVKEGDKIYSMCKKFKAYTKLKKTLEEVDINDFNSYDKFSGLVAASIIDEDEVEDMQSGFLLGDIKNRQFRRQENVTVFPTPFRQINSLTNAGGYERSSILVILDKQKRGKTTTLANLARGYLKMRKKILVIDTENGRDNIFSRLEQSISGLSKKELYSGEYDDKVQRKFRKYKRLGGEIVVERVPALVTTCNDIQSIMDRYYREYGIRFEIVILDYAAKLGSINRRDGDTERISNVYIDLGNLAEKNKIEHIWTANHVTREGAKTRMKTRYVGEDIALCIDIVRHSHAIFGLNRGPEEEEAGFFRMEVVEQRDGKPSGRAVFNINMDTQRTEELTIKERKVYDEEFFSKLKEDEDGTRSVSKKKRNHDLG